MTGEDKRISGTQLAAIISVIILAILVWFTRPLWHWFFMFAYVNPSFWMSIILAIVISGIYYHRKRDDLYVGANTIGVGIAVVVIGWCIFGPFQVMYPQCYLAENLEMTEITELPNVIPETVRVMPYAVSERYAKDALQYPRYRLGTGDITFINQTPCWAYPLIPDGFINYFKLKDKGAVYVDMTTSAKNTRIIEQDMQMGEGMGITDWYRWKLYKEKYWVNYEDPYFILSNQNLYIAVPIVSYEYHWRFPTLYTVPKWSGIALIDHMGNIEFLTPEQAQKHHVLKDQKLFPERLSRYYINSLRYENGIINRLFYHYEQLEIAEVYGQQNEQPFLIMTEEGMKWFIACEPYGEAHGIFRVYMIDARTGDIQFYERPKAEALIGPVKACDYLRKSNPIVDWSRFVPVEPIPVIDNHKLYWHIRVIPEDASGVSYTAMVDAQTADVFELKTDTAIKRFIQEGYENEYEPVEEKEGEGVVAIIIIQEDGREKQRIEIYRNQTFVVIPQTGG